MESRAFIKAAGELITKLEDAQLTLASGEEVRAQREAVQKEVSQLFLGLMNPTLPSSYRLRDVAARHGYFVDPRVLHRLAQFEFITG